MPIDTAVALVPLQNEDRATIRETVESLKLRWKESELSAFQKLEALSDETTIDAVKVPTRFIDGTREKFQGLANIFVALKFKGPRGFEDSTGFKGTFTGHFNDNQDVVIDALDIDTKLFEPRDQ